MAVLLVSAIAATVPALVGCGRKGGAEDRIGDALKGPVDADTSNYTILPFDSLKYWVFKDCKPAKLTSSDLKDIGRIVGKCVDDYNQERKKQLHKSRAKQARAAANSGFSPIVLTKYKRQYFAVTNEKGQKEVWVNCFCETGNPNWKNEPIFVKDGGNCYFNVKINLKTKKYYDFAVNGEA